MDVTYNSSWCTAAWQGACYMASIYVTILSDLQLIGMTRKPIPVFFQQGVLEPSRSGSEESYKSSSSSPSHTPAPDILIPDTSRPSLPAGTPQVGRHSPGLGLSDTIHVHSLFSSRKKQRNVFLFFYQFCS